MILVNIVSVVPNWQPIKNINHERLNAVRGQATLQHTCINSLHFRLLRAPGGEAANTIFKVFNMIPPGIKPQSPGYHTDALIYNDVT